MTRGNRRNTEGRVEEKQAATKIDSQIEKRKKWRKRTPITRKRGRGASMCFQKGREMSCWKTALNEGKKNDPTREEGYSF